MSTKGVLLLLSLCCCSYLTNATTWYISPFGDDSAPGTLKQPLATISGGLAHATAYDTLLLEEGLYSCEGNSQVVVNVSVHIEGQSSGLVKLACHDAVPLLTFAVSANVSNMMLTGGSSGTSASVVVNRPVTVVLERIQFYAAQSYLYGAVVNFTSCTFSGYSEIEVENSNVTVQSCQFVGTTSYCLYIEDMYGGLHGSVHIYDSLFSGIQSGIYGGSGYQTSDVLIQDTVFENSVLSSNLLYFYYSGVTLNRVTVYNCSYPSYYTYYPFITMEYHSLIIKNSHFENNFAPSTNGFIWGYEASITADNCTFIHNNSTSSGGVFYLTTSELTITNTKFHNNHAAKNGGVMYATAASDIMASYSNFVDNSATSGGVCYCTTPDSSVIAFHACYFSGNSPDNGCGK